MTEGGEQKPEEGEKKPEAAVQQQDLKDIVTTDFMKDIISEMNLDIDPNAIGDIIGDMNKDGKEGEEKKDEEEPAKKDDSQKKD